MKLQNRYLWLPLFVSLTACSGAMDGSAEDGSGENNEGQVQAAVVDDNDATQFTYDIGSNDEPHEYAAAIAWLRSQVTTGPFEPDRGRFPHQHYLDMLDGREAIATANTWLRLHIWDHFGSQITLLVNPNNGYIVGYVRRAQTTNTPFRPFTHVDHAFLFNDTELTVGNRAQLAGMTIGTLPFNGSYLALERAAGRARNQTPINRMALLHGQQALRAERPDGRTIARAMMGFIIAFAEGARFHDIEDAVHEDYGTESNRHLNPEVDSEIQDWGSASDWVRENAGRGVEERPYTLGAHIVFTVAMMAHYLAIVQHPPTRKSKRDDSGQATSNPPSADPPAQASSDPDPAPANSGKQNLPADAGQLLKGAQGNPAARAFPASDGFPSSLPFH